MSDLITQADIARLLDVSPQRVGQIIKRTETFPKPVITGAHWSRLWDKQEVELWASARRRNNPRSQHYRVMREQLRSVLAVCDQYASDIDYETFEPGDLLDLIARIREVLGAPTDQLPPEAIHHGVS